MSNPTVCCICLTKDRPEMVERAVRSFRQQTYKHACLMILDTGVLPDRKLEASVKELGNVVYCLKANAGAATIGALRNCAAECWLTMERLSDMRPLGVFAHWDDDDWSHPNRLTEQVTLLQSSGADCVGYNEMLFWDTRTAEFTDVTTVEGGPKRTLAVVRTGGQAWIYRAVNPHHLLGTSLMYWRSRWERHPFDDINHGEDARFVKKLKVCGVSSIVDAEPRMIASIHGGNSSGYAPENDRAGSRRAPEWTDYCAERMQL